MGTIRARASHAAIALLFALGALPAAAQNISSPSALFQSSLNGAVVKICGLFTGGGSYLQAQFYTLRGWPATGAGTLTIGSSSDGGGNCVNLHLSYTGSFTTDQQIYFDISDSVTTSSSPEQTSTRTVYAADPGLVVGEVEGTTSEEGAQARFTVRLSTPPSQQVTVSVTSTDTTEGTVSPSSLAFGSNWWREQTVTATGVADTLTDGDQSWNVRLNPSSGDASYNALADVDVPMTTIDQTGGPAQTGITVASTPAFGSGYRVGETIEARLRFDQAVAVTGTPQLALGIGQTLRPARYVSGSGTRSLTFRYPVVPGDADTNGISIAANALTLNGGSIRLSGGTVSARLTLTRTFTNSASHRVDGSQGAPGIQGITLNSPAIDDAYERGENIDVTVTFTKRVNVVGLPQLALTVGTATRQAVYARELSGPAQLVFRYTVVEADEDTDGISIGPQALTLNGAAIHDGGSDAPAVLAIGHRAITNSDGHKVTGASFITAEIIGFGRADLDDNELYMEGGPTKTATVHISGFGNRSRPVYMWGEIVEFVVTFNRPVVVTGVPTVVMRLGSNRPHASYVAGASTPTALMFRWVVNQTWNSNIRIYDRPRLGDATIQDARDATVAANLVLPNQLASSDGRFSPRSYAPAPSGIEIRVAGGVESDPEVEAVALNAPVVGDTYERGETVEATVTFDRVVDVTGTPQLALGIGDNTRQASYARGTGTDSLVFSYKLVRADVDADGISVAADALTLNSGTIQLMQRTRNAVLGLGDHAITDDGDHKVDGTRLTTPRVDAVFFRSAPANDETYRLGERIDLSVDFDRPVAVTGSPRLSLTIGQQTKQLPLFRYVSPGRLRFRHVVQAGDFDADGLSVFEGALTLNGGAINDDRDATVAADIALGRLAFTNASQYKVDSQAGPPAVVGVTLNPPALGDTYNLGETIEATVAFNKAVDVTGAPRLALLIGTQTRQAAYASGDGDTDLIFRYTVVAADSDTDGLSIEDAALTLNSGTIRELGGTENAALALGAAAVSDSAAHKVDGANAPRAAIGATNPAELEEANLDGATLTVELVNTTYTSGVVASNFTLATSVPGLTVGSLSPVSAGDTQATLTLAYNDTDFDTEQSLALEVAASAHTGAHRLGTQAVPVAATFELRLSRTTLALNERPGANTGTYTVWLGKPPTDPVALTVASTAASVAVDVDGGTAGDQRVLTFTAADYATPRTVSVRALPDDDASAESVAITHSVPVFGNVGEVTATVADDDRGEVLVDVVPSTPRRDPGPLVLHEARGHRLNAARYAVSLSAQPTANVTVAVAVDDASLLSVDAASLTFTPQNWATGRTLTARALDDLDPIGESASISHVANGGGYNGVNGLLRVGLVDDDGVSIDYDVDNDGLIEISTLAQLDAVRWDPRGAGAPSAANEASYRAAFPRHPAGMGCPAATGAAVCTGYELAADLDFDTDGDGATWTGSPPASDSGDAYHNGGAGWSPIGDGSNPFQAVFDGNGHVIHNLFVNSTARFQGLFGVLDGAASISRLGVENARVVSTSNRIGLLAGRVVGSARVAAVWTTGAVDGSTRVGGLLGLAGRDVSVVASYSTAAVTVTDASAQAAGLVGWNRGAVSASYATGAVTGPSGARLHGVTNGPATSSYWNSANIADDSDSTSPEGRTAAQLRAPTSASGIYAGWDALDINGDGEATESPWNFGTSSQYPALSVGANQAGNLAAQRGDYDQDDDGLIEVRSLKQLNAMRWDLDGDGAPSSGNATAYEVAFPNHAADMGCPTDANDADNNDCTGYELENDLDFDTDGDGSTWIQTGATFTADSGDAYHNGSSGWDPIGPSSTPTDSTHFNATFDGNGHIVANLLVNRARDHAGLFAALRGSAVVRELGLPNARVRGASANAAPLAGQNWGRVAAAWASGAAQGANGVGGLLGRNQSGATVVASYSAAAVDCTGATGVGGGLAAANAGTIATSYSTGAVTGACPPANRHGLASGAGTFTASYWDADLSGIEDDAGAASPEGETSANLRAPTGYTGLYALWDNQDVDGDSTSGESVDDDAWDFGESWEHPVLKFGGLSTALQFAQQRNMAPSFPAVPDRTFQRGQTIVPFQVPAATGGEGGTYTYEVQNLPDGLVFDVDGRGSCPGSAARMVCGAPTVGGSFLVEVRAHDGDRDTSDADRGELTFAIAVVTPLAFATATLTEGSLDGATLTVDLTGTVFASRVARTHFTLTTAISGLTVARLATAPGTARAVLTLSYDGTDFDTASTVTVNVADAAHTLVGNLTTNALSVSPSSLDVTVSRATVALNEGATGNTGTYTVVLQTEPTANVTVSVASGDVGAVTVDPTSLTFTTTNWNTARTVTATAVSDDDTRDETVYVVHSAGAAGAVAQTRATVTDDDLGVVLIDADPATPAQDPGPLLLGEGDNAGYLVRLSAQPTGSVAVAVASADTGAVTVDQASLTFTAMNWNTAQTVTAAAVAEADAVDESVTVTHTATGGGYGGTASRLRVGVSDNGHTGTDYDADEDGLIEISTLAQLNAVRWDVNGDGAVSSSNQAAYSGASGAFANASAGMGCPAVSGTATCTGYELVRDLDFDTDGDGSTYALSGNTATSDSDDAYHNSGAGWDPIGPNATPTDSTHFSAVFDGNGHSIHNLFINRGGRNLVGLFGALRPNAVVRSLGVSNAYVAGQWSTGPLVGENYGRVAAVWTGGVARGLGDVAGISGAQRQGGRILASYSTVSVACSGTGPYHRAGGLVALNQSTVAAGAIVASYAAGEVTGGCPTSVKFGVAATGGTVASSYWDIDTSLVADDEDEAAPEGQTTTALQSPTSAVGIYAGWDRVDVDGDGDPAESPWDFGTSSQYPALSYRGMDAAFQRGDYDADDDGLVEISTLAQLNAVRWDLDGDGAPSSGNAGVYRNAFRNHAADMGCPTNGDDADNNDCIGYELAEDLDFDTDGDGSTHTSGTSDSGDAYHNGGSGWDPIGPASTASDSTHFNAVFSGDGHVVRNLFVSRARDYAGLFAATASGATVRSLGVVDAYVDADDYAGAVSGENAGRIAAVWSSGSASGDSHVGGLAGSATAASAIVASYSTASVECTGSAATDLAGGLTGANAGTIAASYSTGAVTGTCPTANKHGLAGGSGTFAASYWDVNRSGIADDSGTASPEGETSANLRAPTGYTGLYAAWDDQDVDGDSIAGESPDDDAWDFGDRFQWPVLKFGGLDVQRQTAPQPSTAPTFGSGAVPNKTFRRNFPIAAFQVPAASGGEGAPYTYSASGLPPVLSFGAPNCAARTVCGTPTSATTGPIPVTIHAHDGDTNRSASDRAELAFTITLVEPTAAIAASNPATLTEATLDGAEVTVTLTNSTFASGVVASHFTPNTTISGVTVDSVATVTAGDTSATLTLAYDDTDFDATASLGVTVAAAAHALSGPITSATVDVTPSLEATVTPPTLTLNEATASNTGTFTAVLQSAPAATTTVTVASPDTGAATVDPATLTFTTQNWSAAQPVTVTAQADDDPNDETIPVTLTAAGVGTLATVTVNVTDDDAGIVLIDADATTAAQDPGPVLVVEDLVGSFERSYTVQLSAQPTANATVAVASSDAPAVRATRGTIGGHAVVSSLTFTTQNWNSPQTVWATAIGDSDAVDESVTISHAATGGGYGGTSSVLRVGVSDDERTGTDYDTDEDGLIEISTLAQLNAVRWDLDGNGAPASNAADYHGASGAFANASTGMGCPTGGCSGYELTQDLDFDTDGDGSTHANGTSDSEDAWHNGGAGWDPIGPSISTGYQERLRRIREESFNAVFDGNGHSIHNLYINRGRDWAALFAAVRADGVVRSLGLANAYVDGGASGSVATLAGTLWGRVEAAWATGAVAGGTNVAGLVGSTNAGSTIVASYSTASADCGTGGAAGLVGHNVGAIVASYATGAVTGSGCQTQNKHGLAAGAGTATASHWDREASGVTVSAQGSGRTTAQLQGPTSATGIFAAWANLDVDGDGDPHESPWDFGKSSHYPVLSYRGMDPTPQRGDYDYDDDGLIEIRTLAQLNAIRWDLDGDGAPSSGNAASWGKAFRNHVATMGCPSDTTGDADLNDCTGYELENDLDFDTDGDGSTHTGGTSDSGDAYHNGGSGWDPIGPNSAPSDSTHFNAIFDGKGQVIENLYVNRSRSYSGLFAALQGDAVVRSLGLRNAHVLNGATYVGLLGGRSAGRVAAVWTSGRAHGSNVVGGLAGLVATGGTIVASYSTAAVECTVAGAQRAGGLASANNGSIVASYSTGTVTGPCQNKSGLAGPRTSGTEGTFAASYWDTTRSGINDDSDANPPEGVTSTNLRTPTGYSGIYSTWDDQDVDGDTTVGRALDADDDAWDFGDQWQWPVLKFGGHDVARQVAEQPNLPPTFTGTVAQSFTYRRNFPIDPFQIPAATGGEGAGGYAYTASGLPPGIVFDADGTGSCPGAAPRMICGTPTTSGTTRVTIHAADGDANTDDDDRAELEFVVAVVDPTAALASNPAALTEATLNGAEVTVTLASAVFESGVAAASFMLHTNVTGLTIGSLATVAAGDASATLTLAYDDTDFDTARTLAVTVAGAAHDLKGALTTASVAVTPSLEATVSPADLTLNEGATATFTAVLDSLPAATTVVAVASSDPGAATVDVAALTFTTTDWNTARTVTVTALADDDADGESVSVTLTAAGVGTLATVPVTVTDDDRGTVLIDADPSTPANRIRARCC